LPCAMLLTLAFSRLMLKFLNEHGAMVRGAADANQIRWIKCRDKWCAKLLVNATQPELGSWVIPSRHAQSGKFTLVCKMCRKARSTCAFAKGLVNNVVFHVLERHGQTPFHIANCKRVTKQCVSDDAAPPVSFFTDLLDKVRGGQATCTPAKLCKGTWCLAEALKV
jgi:hypothetical protein